MTDTIADFLAHCSDLIPEYWRDRLAAALDDDPMTDTNRDAHAVSGVSDAAVEAAARAMCAYDEPDETAAHWDQWHEAYTVAARTALTAALPHLAQPTDEAVEEVDAQAGEVWQETDGVLLLCVKPGEWWQDFRGERVPWDALLIDRPLRRLLDADGRLVAQSSGRGADHTGEEVSALVNKWQSQHDRVCKRTSPTLPRSERHAHDCGITAESAASDLRAALAADEGRGRWKAIEDPRVVVQSYVVRPTGYDEFVHSDKDSWCLTVADGHRWGWSISRGIGMGGGMMMNRKGEFIIESRGSGHNKARRWSLEESLTIALDHVDSIVLNGHTAVQASASVAGRLTEAAR